LKSIAISFKIPVLSEIQSKGGYKMNVYKISKYYIAAEKPEQAYCKWADESSELDFLFDLSNIEEDGEWTEEITIKRLTTEQINYNAVPCCDGNSDCDKCDELEDHIYSTFQEVIESKREDEFPCIIAIEE